MNNPTPVPSNECDAAFDAYWKASDPGTRHVPVLVWKAAWQAARTATEPRTYADTAGTYADSANEPLAARCQCDIPVPAMDDATCANCGNALPTRPSPPAVALRSLIADDAYAATFQSMAQYRAALLAASAQPPGALPDQADVLAWAIRSFGPIAQNIDERAARVAEEAIEIAQVEGVPLETIKRIADRVYSRPPGERWQEIGGTMIGILSYAEIVGLSMAECARREFDRVLSKPREWWQKKHAEKVAAGTADLSPCSSATKGEVP